MNCKTCSKCKIEKPLSEFSKNKSKKDGLQDRCKECCAFYEQQNKDKRREYFSLYHQQNKDKIKERLAIRYGLNKDQIKEHQSLYYQQNKDKIKEQKALYYQQNKDKIKEQRALYLEQNKHKIKEYYQQNKDKLKEYKDLYLKQKYSEQPACIYQILNKQNGKVYIGQTRIGELRWKRHLINLRGKYHSNKKLQQDFDLFGEEAFEWEMLFELPKDEKILLLEEALMITHMIENGFELYNEAITIEQLQLINESKTTEEK